MNDNGIDRALKELFAAVFHNHEKEDSAEIRQDQEKVLNELLNQPDDFKNKVLLTKQGLEIDTQNEYMQYIHAKSVDSRVIIRKSK